MTDITALAREQAQKQIAEGQTLIDSIQIKMKKIVEEFASGEISREQFQKIYEHYQAQIVMAAQMMLDAESVATTEITPGETMAIRKGLTAKAKAMTVYYHATGLLLETIGEFDVPVALISPTLNNIGTQVAAGNKVETRVEKFNNEWLLYMPGKYSTAVMLLSHEPAARQIGIMESMQRDFEGANENVLKGGQADGSALVYPFKAIVRRSVAK